jgi:hypothetical protein
VSRALTVAILISGCGRFGFDAYSDGTRPDGRGADGGPGDTAITASLEAWWTFDENSGISANDASGNGRNGVLTAGTGGVPVWVAGRSGSALQLDKASDNYVEVVVTATWGFSSALTVSGWVKKAAPDSNGVWIARWLAGHDSFSMEIGPPGMPNIAMARLSPAGSGGTTLNGNRQITDTAWHHYASVFDGSTGLFSIYVDGVLDAQVSTGYTSFFPVQDQVQLGGWPECCTGQTIDGTVDDIRLYSRALTESEIQSL